MKVGDRVSRTLDWLAQHGGPNLVGTVTGFDTSWEGEDWPLVLWDGAEIAEPCYPASLRLNGNGQP